MSEGEGLIVIMPAAAGAAPHWWKVAGGHIVSRSAGAAMAGSNSADGARRAPVMLVLPMHVVTLRRVDLPAADMPPAQARAAAQRIAREASIEDGEGLHAVAALDDPSLVAVIARQDMAHVIAWAREQGLEPDIIVPAAALVPEAEEGFASAILGDTVVLRGQGLFADASQPWLRDVIADAPVAQLDAESSEAVLVRALDNPPLNLRTGEFALPRKSAIGPGYWKRLAVWVGFIALATLLISLALIVKYHWSAARLDAKTVAVARTVLPAANDAELVEEELDRLLMARGGSGYGFTGPVAGLMTAMQGVPGVSLTALSRGDDGLVHATLASPRAEDINRALIDLQSAGFRITATSSADPSGRVVAQITVSL